MDALKILERAEDTEYTTESDISGHLDEVESKIMCKLAALVKDAKAVILKYAVGDMADYESFTQYNNALYMTSGLMLKVVSMVSDTMSVADDPAKVAAVLPKKFSDR